MITPQDADSSSTTSQTWVIDQITEQSVAVEIPGASLTTMPLWLFPKDLHEGDVLRITREQQSERTILTIVKDTEERLRRLSRSKDQVATISKNDQQGDIIL